MISIITIVETTDSNDKEMDPVSITISNPRKEIGGAGDRTCDLLSSSPTWLQGSDEQGMNHIILTTVVNIRHGTQRCLGLKASPFPYPHTHTLPSPPPPPHRPT